MRVYLTGADGLLGTALLPALRATEATAGWLVRGVSLADFDIVDAAALDASIDDFRPDVVVHAAALAIVDECEADPSRALRVNVDGTHNVVAASRRHGSRLVYLSSDYVFDGAARPEGGYREDDVPNPLSIYGLTKLAGERVAATVPGHLVVRTSWLFGGCDEGTDNVLRLVRRIVGGQPERLVTDQVSRPTFTADLAAALVYLLADKPDLVGTIHIANSGSASWYQVGEAVADALARIRPDTGFRPELLPVRLADCGYLGQRPRDSSLNTDRLAELGHAMPVWTEAVYRFCADLLGRGEAATVHVEPVRVGSA